MATIPDQGVYLPQWMTTVGASAMSAVAAIVITTINQSSNFQRIIQESTRILIVAYEKRVEVLVDELRNQAAHYDKKCEQMEAIIAAMQEEITRLKMSAHFANGDGNGHKS